MCSTPNSRYIPLEKIEWEFQIFICFIATLHSLSAKCCIKLSIFAVVDGITCVCLSLCVYYVHIKSSFSHFVNLFVFHSHLFILAHSHTRTQSSFHFPWFIFSISTEPQFVEFIVAIFHIQTKAFYFKWLILIVPLFQIDNFIVGDVSISFSCFFLRSNVSTGCDKAFFVLSLQIDVRVRVCVSLCVNQQRGFSLNLVVVSNASMLNDLDDHKRALY